jgi:surface polysaccharide O-acyltransferase-like enzyme
MNLTRNSTGGNSRLYFLDNLRTVIIFFVILYHAGGVYESTGVWASFWIVDDPATNNIAGFVNLVLDIFMMPTLFFISGYLAPASLENKNGWTFIKRRFWRLIFPWIVVVLTLIPLYKVIYLVSRNLPQESWTSYFHFSSGHISSQAWLWFPPLLFAFNILYLLLSKANIRIPNLSLRSAVVGTFLIGWLFSTGMDLFGLRGWTLTPLIDFQNERLLIYFLYFLLGALCYTLRVFGTKPESKKLYTIVNSVSWIPLTGYIIFLLVPFLNPGAVIVSRVIDRVIVWFLFHLSLLSLVYMMIQTFWLYFDKPGTLWGELNRNSYGVYLIHVIVLGAIALLLLDSSLPSILKYLLLAVSTFLASNLLLSLFRRAAASIRGRRKMHGIETSGPA